MIKKGKRVFSTVSAYRSPKRVMSSGKHVSIAHSRANKSPTSIKSSPNRQGSMKSYNMDIFKKEMDANTIDFSAKYGTEG